MDERLVHVQISAEAGGASEDSAQDVAAPLIRGHDAIRNGKRQRPDVVGDDPMRDAVIRPRIGDSRDLVDGRKERTKYIRIVVRIHVVDHGHHALEAHAGVHMFGGQVAKRAISLSVKLDEHQIPDFDVSRTPGVDAANVIWVILFVAFSFSQIVMDFGAGTARPGVAHLPEIIALAKAQNSLWRNGGDLRPKRRGFLVGIQIVLCIAFENRGPHAVAIQAPDFGEQLPGPLDGFFLEIVAKGPVAEHLKERVVVGVESHIFEIVVLATHPNALLRVDGALVIPCFQTEKDVLELIHPRVDKQQGGIIKRHHR